MTAKTFAFAAALLLAGGCGAAAKETPQGGPKPMSDARDKATEALTLNDADYFKLDQDRINELSLKLSGLFPKGPKAPPGPPATFLAVGAPRTASLDKHHEVPLLVGLRYTDQREWEVHLEQNALIVVSDLKTGEIRTGWPFMMGKRRETPPPSRSGPAPEPEQATWVTTGVRHIDLRQLFDRTWPTTRLAVGAIDYDWASNVVVIDIEKEGPPPAEAKPRKPSPFLNAGAAAPGGPGASLVVPAKASKGSPLMLKGSLNLEKDRVATAPLEGTPNASLAIASVVFRKLDREEPVQIDIAARAEIVDEKGTPRIRAGFEFDVWNSGIPFELEGAYQVYLAAGTALAGPYPLTIER